MPNATQAPRIRSQIPSTITPALHTCCRHKSSSSVRSVCEGPPSQTINTIQESISGMGRRVHTRALRHCCNAQVPMRDALRVAVTQLTQGERRHPRRTSGGSRARSWPRRRQQSPDKGYRENHMGREDEGAVCVRRHSGDVSC